MRLMTVACVCWLIAHPVLNAFAPLPDKDASKADMATLQGTWELQDQKKGTPAKWTLEVKGRTFIFRADEKITRQVIATLDASKQPKALDLKEDGEDRPILAIYKLEKDRLTLCIGVDKARPTETRPTGIEEKPGRVLTTYTKAKR